MEPVTQTFSLADDSQPDSARCPVCGFTCSHIREVFTRVGSEWSYAIGAYKGTKARGVVFNRPCLVIVFDGECGHAWEWRIQQYKGENQLEIVAVPLSEEKLREQERREAEFRIAENREQQKQPSEKATGVRN